MERCVCGSRTVMLWRKEMERGPHRGRVGDWWVKGRLGGATHYDRNIKRPLWTRPILRSANRVNMLGPPSSESMGRAGARKTVRPEGVIIYLDLPHQPRNSSPDHRKQIRKVGRIRLAHKGHFDEVFRKLLLGAQAEEWVSSVMRVCRERRLTREQCLGSTQADSQMSSEQGVSACSGSSQATMTHWSVQRSSTQVTSSQSRTHSEQVRFDNSIMG
jgi:hypothetical protein